MRGIDRVRRVGRAAPAAALAVATVVIAIFFIKNDDVVVSAQTASEYRYVRVGAGPAYDINDLGVIVGKASGSGSGYVWSEASGIQPMSTDPAIVSRFPGVGNNGTRLVSINDGGTIAGQGFDPVTSRYAAATLDPLAGLVILGAGGDTGDGQQAAHAINNLGVVVGRLRGNAQVPFIWRPGFGLSQMGMPSAGGSDAHDVNDAGQVVGGVLGTAYVWTVSGGRFDIPKLTTAPTASYEALAINELGIVAGRYDGAIRGVFLWSPGTGTVDLGAPAGAVFGPGYVDINDAGDVVATIVSSVGVSVPYRYRDGQWTNLNALLPAGTDALLAVVTGINNAGAIVGWGGTAAQPQGINAFVLVPQSAPLARDMVIATDEDVAVSGTLDASDADSPVLTYQITTPPARGAVTLDTASGAFTYTPGPNVNGSDTFGFTASDGNRTSNEATVSVDIAAVNDPPVAADSAIATAANVPITGTFIAEDIDSASLSYTIVTNGSLGVAEVLDAASGLFRYTPSANSSGADQFTFQVTDGGLVSNVATVSVAIAATNHPPNALRGVLTTTHGTAVNGVLAATDPDGDVVTFSVAVAPAHGVVSITNAATGAFTYTPEPSASGYDAFTFRASDGTLSTTAEEMVFIVADRPQWPGQVALASVGIGGVQSSGYSDQWAMSADGRFVVFRSLVVDTSGSYSEVLVHDRLTADSELVSIDPDGNPLQSARPQDISADGRFVLFLSTGGVFVRDRVLRHTIRVDVNDSGVPPREGVGGLFTGALSADGRIAVFSSQGSNLVPGGANGVLQLFVRDMITLRTTRVSVSTDGIPANALSPSTALSADGRLVVFSSLGTNLVPDDTNGVADVFLHDRGAGTTTRVSVASGGTQGDGDSSEVALSGDGRHVAFSSNATNLVPNDTNGAHDVFVLDRLTGQMTRVSVGPAGGQANGESFEPSLSADGRFVTFVSLASNLVASDINGTADIFVHDRQTGQTTLVGVAPEGTSGGNSVSRLRLSADGRFVGFYSHERLTPDDLDDGADVFIAGGTTVTPQLATVPRGGGTVSVQATFAYPGAEWTATSTVPWAVVTDQSSATGNGTVTLTIAPNPGPARTGTVQVANQSVTIEQAASVTPTAFDGALDTLEDVAAGGTLAATAPEGQALTFSIVANGSRGVATIADPGTGAYTYTPNPDAHGVDHFMFRANDGASDSNTATITVNIGPVNDPPVALNGVLSTEDGQTTAGTLSGSDVDGPALTFAIVSNGVQGVATITDASTGAFTYTANAGALGSDVFTFQVSDGSQMSNVAAVSVTITRRAVPSVALSPSHVDFGGQRVGTSSTAPHYAAGGFTAFVATGDMNRDGVIDLLTAAQVGGTVSVLLNRGDGTFAPRVAFATGGSSPTALVVRDLDGDGILDVAVTNQGTRDVSVLLGEGDGTLRLAGRHSVSEAGNASAFGITAGQFNGDAHLDLAIGGNAGVRLLLGAGDGTFVLGALVPASGVNDVASGDFDGDGRLDVATANQVFLGNGDGTFGSGTYLSVSDAATFVAVADFNGDSRLDVARTIAGVAGRVTIHLGNGDGTFAQSGTYGVGRAPFFGAAGDLNGDGRADLAVASQYDSSVRVLVSNTDGSFLPVVNYGYFAFAQAVAMAPLDDDGRLDVAVAGLSSVGVLLGKGDGTLRASRTVTLLNTGTAPLNPRVAIDGPDADQFSVEAMPCQAVIDPGSGCPIIVRFYPTSPGAKSAVLRVESDAPGSPHEIALSGSGLVAPIAEDASFTTEQGTPLLGQLTASGPEGDDLTFTLVSNGSLGTAVITDAATGAFVYSPSPGAVGTDTFTFQARNGTLTSNVAAISIEIQAPTLAITLVAPIGGERVFVNVPTLVTWTVSAATTIDVELSRDGGVRFVAVPGCTALSGSTTSCAWTPSGGTTTSALVRVTARGAGATTATDVSEQTFTIARASVTVTAPNTAVSWAAGSTRTITWNHTLGADAAVRIELTRDGGASWELIAPSVQGNTATSGTFRWLVSGPGTTSARIRITWGDNWATDVGNALFSIVTPTLTVTAPNTNVNWRIGTTQTVRWTHNLGVGELMRIERSDDGGTTWTVVASEVPNSAQASGVYQWLVTGPVTTSARVRVTWLGNVSISDVGDIDFRVSPRITVTSPNAAVTYGAGSMRTMTWNHDYGPAQTFRIDFSGDSGSTWELLAASVPAATASTGTYTGRFPASPTTQALIRVSPAGAPGDGDVSNVPFTLVMPTITVTAPNTNVNWPVGSSQNIRWTHNLGTGESVRIERSDDGGASWTVIAAEVRNSANTAGAYPWVVTGPVTSAARIRVTWVHAESVQDSGNVNFRISASTATVTSAPSLVAADARLTTGRWSSPGRSQDHSPPVW
jgi:hypothetical protein